MISLAYAPAGARVNARSSVSEADNRAFEMMIDALDPAPAPSIVDMEDAAVFVRRSSTVSMSQDVLEIVAGHAMLATSEGRTFRLTLSPGTAAVSCHDLARSDRALERDRIDPVSDHLALYVGEQGTFDLPEAKVTRRAVTEWSPKSRSRMFRTIPTLDLAEWTEDEGDLAMVTLTMPRHWEHLAPTGAEFKRLIELFRRRYIRAGLVWRGLWKLEFQGRGAPHLHALMRVPALVKTGDTRLETFTHWLRRTWADVVGADDQWCYTCVPALRGPLSWASIEAACVCGERDSERRRHLAAGTGVDLSGSKYSDPRRIATYFLGHSSKHVDGKEYQHIVPEPWQAPAAGPGRFWGYWGLNKATVHVDLDQREWYAVRRMLRNIARARSWKQTQDAARWGKTVRRYPLRSLGHRGGLAGGTVVVNDGLALAYDLGRALAVLRAPLPEDQPMSPREARFRDLRSTCV